VHAVPEPHPRRPLGAPDPNLVPDPTFWGPTHGPPSRHRRRRPPGLAARVTGVIPSRDARTAIAAAVAVLILTTVLVSYRMTVPAAVPTTPAAAPVSSRPARPVTPRRVVVHVAGAVTHPGVVTLPGGDRVIDAIDRAGGARPDANLDALNLAAQLRDGQQVLVPSTTNSTTPTSTGFPAAPVPTVTPQR
jgi:competence protein ComEA